MFGSVEIVIAVVILSGIAALILIGQHLSRQTQKPAVEPARFDYSYDDHRGDHHPLSHTTRDIYPPLRQMSRYTDPAVPGAHGGDRDGGD